MAGHFYQDVMDAINEAIEMYGSASNLCAACNIQQANISRWKNGKNGPKLSEVAKIMDEIGITLQKSGIDTSKYILVDKVEAKAGAGASLEDSSRVLGQYAFRRDFFHRIGISEQTPVMMQVEGDSMEPFIKSGDTILVDQSVKQLRNNEIFVTRLGEEIMVKRAIRLSKGWRLCSLNPERPNIDIEDNDEQFSVIGRVRWFGRVV